MEEGSLLQEALRRHTQQADGGDDNDMMNRSALVVDLYLLRPPPQNVQGHLLQLAEVAVQLNASLQNNNNNNHNHPYPWISGGDGPVFGVHIQQQDDSSCAVPHLRANCRYFGVSVDDEWELVGRLLTIASTTCKYDWAAECWDVDDGQLLLIEAAEHLPDWVDAMGPEHCRHRCWIRPGGEIVLIRPTEHELNSPKDVVPPLSLAEALKLLKQQQQQHNSLVQIAPAPVQNAIRDRIARVGRQYHRTAVAVPRSVAHLLHERPDLVSTACRLFVEQASNGNTAKSESRPLSSYLAGTLQDNDWVWTTISMGRTPYAMLRTVTAAPDWMSEDAIPPPFSRLLPVKQLKRQCCVEATPHLRHGLQLGVRMVAGLEYGLQQPTATIPGNEHHHQHDSGMLPQRLVHWTRLAAAAGNNNDTSDSDWLMHAWQAGPNHSTHNLAHVLQCPVYDPEMIIDGQSSSLTPLSHPETSLADQIRHGLRRSATNEIDYDNIDPFGDGAPRPDQVDSEDWMWMSGDDRDDELFRRAVGSGARNKPEESTKTDAQQTYVKNNNAAQTAPLDDVLSGVQSFMAGQSSVEGVTTASSASPTTPKIAINPAVFLHLLHATLQSATAEELEDRLRAAAASDATTTRTTEPNHRGDESNDEDPFFHREDYNLINDENNDDDDENSATDAAMTDVMRAMDEELQQQSTARQLDGPDADGDSCNDSDNDTAAAMAEDVHVLSNLLKSLDAGAGGPGPIKNLLGEMGVRAPDLRPTDSDGDNDDE